MSSPGLMKNVVPAAPDQPAPQPEDEVLGKRVLPFTGGGDPTAFIVAAGVLMASGGGMVLTSRRRGR